MNIPNNKKSETGAGSSKKMLFNDVRSRNVYENKGKLDKMPDEKSDIYVDVTWFLQKIAGLIGHLRRSDTVFAENCGFEWAIGSEWSFRGRSARRLRGRRAIGDWGVAAKLTPL